MWLKINANRLILTMFGLMYILVNRLTVFDIPDKYTKVEEDAYRMVREEARYWRDLYVSFTFIMPLYALYGLWTEQKEYFRPFALFSTVNAVHMLFYLAGKLVYNYGTRRADIFCGLEVYMVQFQIDLIFATVIWMWLWMSADTANLLPATTDKKCLATDVKIAVALAHDCTKKLPPPAYGESPPPYVQ